MRSVSFPGYTLQCLAVNATSNTEAWPQGRGSTADPSANARLLARLSRGLQTAHAVLTTLAVHNKPSGNAPFVAALALVEAATDEDRTL